MKRTIALILKIFGAILITAASFALLLGLWLLITGEDGFTDAAPWWYFLFLVAAVSGIPGLILMLISRFISKEAKEEK
jgi:hypothetical protein